MDNDRGFFLKTLRDIWATVAGAALALALLWAALVLQLDVIKLDLQLLDRIHQHHIDDLLTAAALFFGGLVVDMVRRRRRRRAELEAQKLRTLKATMRTVQDIVNNFLNNLLLFQMEAQHLLPPDAFDPIEELSRQTFDRLKALGNVEEVREITMGIGLGVDYLEPASVRPHFS